MKKVSLILIVALAVTWISAPGLAQFKPDSGGITGYMVNEYFYFADHNDEDLKGRHGLWFRRIYFTYDNNLSDTVKMRLRLEMNSTSDLFSSLSLVPFVKDAYLSIKLGKSDLVAGIMGPPSYAKLEDIWGWRPLEKTPLDLYEWQSSRDMGIALKGGKILTYNLMFANGSSNKSETNNGKKIYGALGYQTEGFYIEAMAQYERVKEADDDVIIQGFGAYQTDWGRVGVQYAYRDYKEEGADDSLAYHIFSVFAVVKAGEKMELIGRYDMNFGEGYRSHFTGGGIAYVPFADNHEFSFIIAALSYQVVKNVWLVPNIKYAFYNENEDLKDAGNYTKPGNDFYANLMLYFKF